MFSVMRSTMVTINGRLNFKTGVLWKSISVMSKSVAAAAVAPASLTSRVAWCTTCSETEIKLDGWNVGKKMCVKYIILRLRLPVFAPLKCHSNLQDH